MHKVLMVTQENLGVVVVVVVVLIILELEEKEEVLYYILIFNIYILEFILQKSNLKHTKTV